MTHPGTTEVYHGGSASFRSRADDIIKDILVNHLPRVVDGLQKGYVDENQILVIYDHAVRARILREHAAENTGAQ